MSRDDEPTSEQAQAEAKAVVARLKRSIRALAEAPDLEPDERALVDDLVAATDLHEASQQIARTEVLDLSAFDKDLDGE